MELNFHIPIYGLHLKHVSSLEYMPEQRFRLAGFDDPANFYQSFFSRIEVNNRPMEVL